MKYYTFLMAPSAPPTNSEPHAIMPTQLPDEDEDMRKRGLNAFWKVARQNFTRGCVEANKAWKSPDARFYRPEKRMLTEHFEPFCWGAGIGFLFLAAFRVSGSQWYARIRQTQFPATPAVAAKKQATKTEHATVFKSHLEQRTEKLLQVKESSGWTTDIILSIMCGLSSAFWLTKPSQLKSDFIGSPLLPGRSIVHSSLCSEMEEAYQREIGSNVELSEEDSLFFFQAFVQNCRHRSDYIQARQQEGAERPDVVPYPGLDGRRRS